MGYKTVLFQKICFEEIESDILKQSYQWVGLHLGKLDVFYNKILSSEVTSSNYILLPSVLRVISNHQFTSNERFRISFSFHIWRLPVQCTIIILASKRA